MTRPCHHCGTSFVVELTRREKYCSRSCYHAAIHVDPAVIKEQSSLKAKAKYLANRQLPKDKSLGFSLASCQPCAEAHDGRDPQAEAH